MPLTILNFSSCFSLSASCTHPSHSSMNGQRGDDLDDDFVPDELVATSGEEDEVDNRPGDHGDDIDGLLSADEDAEESQEKIKEKSATEKKRKRREKEKERKAKVRMTSLSCSSLH